MKSLEIAPFKFENEKFTILDQTRLPADEVYLEIENGEDIYRAIKTLAVRGAPAIGVAAAYGYFVSVRTLAHQGMREGWSFERLYAQSEDLNRYIASSRPTAVNLMWALERMWDRFNAIWKSWSLTEQASKSIAGDDRIEQLLMELRAEAQKIHQEDISACYDMGKYGLSLLKPSMGILTHCNAGTIATSKYGTCLAPLYLGNMEGYNFRVFADETRPLLQGARLTAWELHKSGIDVTLICDNMASTVMKQGKIDAVVVGCDRMAANGDGANKIGTAGLAVLAKEYKIPFYMFVPTSTIDLDTPTGYDIEVEERDGKEIYSMWYEKSMAPEGIKTFNPAFDVTASENITAVVTEQGIVYPPFDEGLKRAVEAAKEKSSTNIFGHDTMEKIRL